MTSAASSADHKLSRQLLTASGKGLSELVALLVERRASVNHARDDGWTPLMAACSIGHLPTATVLISSRADIAAAAEDSFTALLEAAAQGHHEIVDVLLQSNASAMVSAKNGTTPLILASMHGHLQTAQLLVDHGADVGQAKHDGFAPLRAACGNGHTSVVRLLMESRANFGGEEGAAALLSASAHGHLGTMGLLLENGIAANAAIADGSTALVQACLANQRQAAAMLVANGADVEAALAMSVRTNQPGIRRVLGRIRPVASGATAVAETRDIDSLVSSIEGDAQVQRQASHGRGRAGRKRSLVSAGSSEDVRSVQTAAATPTEVVAQPGDLASITAAEKVTPHPGRTAVLAAPEVVGVELAGLRAVAAAAASAAAASSAVAMAAERRVATLYQAPVGPSSPAIAAERGEDAGASRRAHLQASEPSGCEGHGDTAPMLAVADRCDTDIAADVSPTDQRLSQQLLTAAGKGLTRLVTILLQRRADANHSRSDGWTPLMAACSAGDAMMVECLLTGAADLEACTSDGFTALLEASTHGHLSAAAPLLRFSANVSHAALDGTTALILSSLYGHASIASLLLAGKADPLQAKGNGLTPLQAACGNGRDAVARVLLDACGSGMLHDEQKALLAACAGGHAASAQVLLDRRASGVAPAMAREDGTDALIQACAANHRGVASLLVAHRADVDAVFQDPRCKSQPGVRKVLTKVMALGPGSRGLELETRDLDTLVDAIEQSGQRGVPAAAAAGRAPAGAAPASRSQRRARASPKRGADAKSPAEPAESLLALPDAAAEQHGGDVEPASEGQVRAKVDSDCCFPAVAERPDAEAGLQPAAAAATAAGVVGSEDVEGRAAAAAGSDSRGGVEPPCPEVRPKLLAACQKGSLSEVVELITQGVDVNFARADGWTPLMAACSGGHEEVVEQLLMHGASMSAASSEGFTPVLEACASGRTSVVALLVRRGADIGQGAHDGTTPLILASLRGHLQLVSLLLAHQADVHCCRSGGFGALRAACGNGYAAVASLLLEHGACAEGAEGSLALISACANGHVVVAQLLIERGASVVDASPEGITPLMQACVAGHHEVAGLLIVRRADTESVLHEARLQNSFSAVTRVLNRARSSLQLCSDAAGVGGGAVASGAGDGSGGCHALGGDGQAADGRAASGESLFASVQRRIRKFSKKAERIRALKEKQRHDGGLVDENQQRLIASEREVLAVLTELAALQEQLVKGGHVSPAAGSPETACPSSASGHAAAPCAPGVQAEAAASELGVASQRLGKDAEPAPAPATGSHAPGRAPVVNPVARPENLPAPPGWQSRQLPSLDVRGTCFTVEVLCPGSDDSSSPARGVVGGQRRNAAVVAARCRGWSAQSLSQIPLDHVELVDSVRLAYGGISSDVVAGEGGDDGSAIASPRPPASPISSGSACSLPDRDSPEEFIAWCAEEHRRCRRVAAC